MQDGIINETGNSRYLRTVAGIKQLAPTYDAFLNLLISGDFPIDLNGINTDGWAQLGTELNKANMLTDATAALVDLGSEATLNEMLAALANKLNTIEDFRELVQNLQKQVKELQDKIDSLITASPVDLTAGTSPLESGKYYFVYE